ncbi:UNVERIFIED_CONTAM: hypothetical protein GTU68_015908 [Idotea baltica]|nr:hypothetical protein [Idotea baltica]
MKIWPFHVVKDEENLPKIRAEFNKKVKSFSPEEISSIIIKKLKSISEKYLGQIIHDAVISVPAYFDSNQKAATRNAGLIAGLNVKHIINEPTAAALAYGFGRDGIKGDSHLGGEDFTNRMVNHLLRSFSRETFEDINADLFNMTMDLVTELLLVGGSTRIPKIRSMLESKFGKEKLNFSLNPDDAVALGAAIEAAILSNDLSEDVRNMSLKDVTPLSLGMEIRTDHQMKTFIPRNTQLPSFLSWRFL